MLYLKYKLRNSLNISMLADVGIKLKAPVYLIAWLAVNFWAGLCSVRSSAEDLFCDPVRNQKCV